MIIMYLPVHHMEAQMNESDDEHVHPQPYLIKPIILLNKSLILLSLLDERQTSHYYSTINSYSQ